MDYQKILKQAIDLHVHIGPDIVPRRFNRGDLLSYEKGKLRGVAVKNHFFPTIATSVGKGKKDFLVIDSVVLNNYTGGFNPEIIRIAAELSKLPIIVWFPTLHAKNILAEQKFEIPQEWLGEKRILKPRLAKDIKVLGVFDDQGNISGEVRKVLWAIKDCQAVLATGHLSWPESLKLVEYAVFSVGLKKIIITHPIYQKINMPLDVQKRLASMGAFIEHCYSMHSIDKISIAEIVSQIKEVGVENCLLSSDVGQIFSKSPSEALTDFMSLLEKEGLAEEEIKIMLVDNPGRVIGLGLGCRNT